MVIPLSSALTLKYHHLRLFGGTVPAITLCGSCSLFLWIYPPWNTLENHFRTKVKYSKIEKVSFFMYVSIYKPNRFLLTSSSSRKSNQHVNIHNIKPNQTRLNFDQK